MEVLEQDDNTGCYFTGTKDQIWYCHHCLLLEKKEPN